MKDNYTSYQKYVDFIKKYRLASNAASGSQYDSNANVSNKNVATMQGELPKGDLIGTNRLLMINKLKELYPETNLAEQYIEDLSNHIIYKHDETSIRPYTYASTEVVNVKYNDRIYTVSLSRLYEICQEEEVLLDEEKGVWGKYPKNMSIEDRNGFTNISRLIKKKRHRNLVRVKNAFSNDIIVTDNHPIIISDSIEDTISAIDSKGKQQYRCSSKMKFEGKTKIDMSDVLNIGEMLYEPIEHGYLAHIGKNAKWYSYPKEINISREMGYFVGFFIGDGDFELANNLVNITQKDNEVLYKLADILFTHFNAASYIKHSVSSNKYTLTCSDPAVYFFIRNILGIMPKAYAKTLPENIFEYNRDFAIGVIEGIVDSDGTVESSGTYSIRLSSRTACLQISQIVNALGITTGMSTQQSKFGCNERITQKYQLFGVRFREPAIPIFTNSYKSIKAKSITKGKKSSFDEWQTITNVELIDNEPYLDINDYIYDITTETHSFVCNGLWVHNCVSISMYPFLKEGMSFIGGCSKAPKHLDSFCGEFINLVFAVASQFAGAVSTPEFLTYLDYFIRQDFGDDYYLRENEIVYRGRLEKTIGKIIKDKFEQIVHSMNIPAAARDCQSVFWNIAYFDKNYFDGIFGDFLFPDETEPQWESVNWLQKFFMKWFNAERSRSELTFPVETVNLLNDGKTAVDQEWLDFIAEMYAEGHSFFTYTSSSVDSLASCCRLRNELQENTFSFTLGAGGVATGSKGVITMNVNRIVQDAVKENKDISDTILEITKRVHKYLFAFNEIIKDNLRARLLPVYDSNMISMDKQFLTLGINGFVEGAEFLGIDISANEKYFEYGEKILKPIYDLNKAERTSEIMWNTEFVPAENLGVKNAKWDKQDGYIVPRDCYNSYFYKVEDETCSIIDKLILHGSKLTKYLDGGSAAHLNLNEYLTKEQYIKVIETAIKTGCSYFTFNIPNTVCNDCGHISKHNLKTCPICGSTNVDWLTRIIGYLKRISSFSEARQEEAAKRYYE